MAAKRRFEMNESVRKNLKRDAFSIPEKDINTHLEWSQQRVADLHTFEEMRTYLNDPVIEDCEVAWDAESNVTCTVDSDEVKWGTYSALATIAEGHTTGLAATNVIEETDFTDFTHVKFWIKSSVANAAGGLQFLLDDTATCASPLETLNIPALEVDVWKECTLKLSSPSAASAIISVGLKVITDVGAQLVYLDEVRKVRCTSKDVARYSPPTDTKNILGITLQDGASSRPLKAIYFRLFDQLRPNLRQTTAARPTHYIDYGSYFELYPLPDKAYPMYVRYSKYPTPFSESKVVMEDCEDAWTAKSNVTSTADTAFVKLGTKSAKHVIAAGHTTGLVSTEDFSSMDLSSYSHLKFWMRTSVALNEGDLQMVLDDTAACASPLESLDIPAMLPDLWYEHTLPLVTPSLLTAIISVGINGVVDNGALTIYQDDIRAVSSSLSVLLRKDQVIEAGATIYGFQFLRQEKDAKEWNTIFVGMMGQVMKTDKNHEDLLQMARGFGDDGGMYPAGDPWLYPELRF